MEPSHQTRKIIGRILAWGCAAGLAAAFYAYITDPLLPAVSARKNTSVRVVFFTQPAMRFSYNPSTRKAAATLASQACRADAPSACFDGDFKLFFIPKETSQPAFWAQLKEGLSTWRFNPAPIGKYIDAYVNALVQKRTNILPAQFIALSLELAELTASDFAIEQPVLASKKKNKKQPPAAAEPASQAAPQARAAANQPLKVVILNASGKKGLAESLKQYLRGQYAKGLLQVDVYDTGNYPSLQDHSFIEDYSGQLVQVTQISHAIGILGEIHSQKPTAELYYDSRIILGKDFKMPL